MATGIRNVKMLTGWRPTEPFFAPERLKGRVNAKKHRLLKRWTSSKSHLFIQPPLLNLCFSRSSSAGGFWSLPEWQVWALALGKGYRRFQTAEFTSGGGIRQSDDARAHSPSLKQPARICAVIFYFYFKFTSSACFFFNPRLKTWSACEKLSCDSSCSLTARRVLKVKVIVPAKPKSSPEDANRGLNMPKYVICE